MEIDIVTVWLVCGVIGLILELFLPGFIIFFFGCGAIVTGLTLWIVPTLSFEATLTLFMISSVVLLLVFRKLLKNKFFNKQQNDETNELNDEFIGKPAVAISTFEAGYGQVEFKGTKWNAKSDESINKGDVVTIADRENITLIVKH